MCHNNLNLKSEENWAAKPPPNTTERITTQWLPKVDSWTMFGDRRLLVCGGVLRRNITPSDCAATLCRLTGLCHILPPFSLNVSCKGLDSPVMLQGLRTDVLRNYHTLHSRSFVILQPFCEVHGNLPECCERYILRCISFLGLVLHRNMCE